MTELDPRERRHANTRQAILDAARQLVRRNGIESLSMRKIARQIDYSAAGLYEYFSSKEELIGTLCGDADARLGGYLQRVPADLPPRQRLVELGLAYVQFALENPELFELLFTYTLSSRASLQEPYPVGSSYAVLAGAVEEMAEAGVFDPHSVGVEGITYSFWAFVHGMATLRLTYLKEFDADFSVVNRWALERYFDGLVQPS